MRTNDLFRDLLENRIPGHETPRTVTITITPEFSFDKLFQQKVNRAIEYALMASRGALRTTFFTGEWIDYGWRRGLTGMERVHFNDAVEKMARTNPWTRDECAEILGKITDAAERAELGPLRPPPPADPRARALHHKQHQGHGPDVETLRVRGRNNKYKEKF